MSRSCVYAMQATHLRTAELPPGEDKETVIFE